MIAPYYADGVATIYHADYVDVLDQIGPVDAVVTDPPYNTRTADVDLPGRLAFRRDFGTWDQDFDPSALMQRLLPVVTPGGSVIVFTSDRILSEYRNAPGWKPRGTLVWLKPNAPPQPRPGYVQTVEFIAWLQKAGAAATWNGTGYIPNVLQYGPCVGLERTEHPTQKPETLIVELITRHTRPGDRILDPFMGSGTTLAAAKRVGRRAVGVDINERYCEIAATRLQQSALPFASPPDPSTDQTELFTGDE